MLVQEKDGGAEDVCEVETVEVRELRKLPEINSLTR